MTVDFYREKWELLYFADFADELLDNVWKTAYKDLPVNFASGLTGIAWSIEYLLQNNFVLGEGNIICEEIDNKIISLDLRRLNSDFIENDLEGLLHYILIRIKGSIIQQTKLPFDDMYYTDIFQVFHSLQKTHKFSNVAKTLINQLFDFMDNKNILDYNPSLISFIEEERIFKNDKDILSSSLGLKNGLAGYLYKQLIDKRV